MTSLSNAARSSSQDNRPSADRRSVGESVNRVSSQCRRSIITDRSLRIDVPKEPPCVLVETVDSVTKADCIADHDEMPGDVEATSVAVDPLRRAEYLSGWPLFWASVGWIMTEFMGGMVSSSTTPTFEAQPTDGLLDRAATCSRQLCQLSPPSSTC